MFKTVVLTAFRVDGRLSGFVPRSVNRPLSACWSCSWWSFPHSPRFLKGCELWNVQVTLSLLALQTLRYSCDFSRPWACGRQGAAHLERLGRCLVSTFHPYLTCWVHFQIFRTFPRWGADSTFSGERMEQLLFSSLISLPTFRMIRGEVNTTLLFTKIKVSSQSGHHKQKK